MNLMDKYGRNQDLIIEDFYLVDEITGEKNLSSMLVVWADEGVENIVFKIDGVTNVAKQTKTLYYVFLDPRYDRDFVKKEIEAKILCRKENE